MSDLSDNTKYKWTPESTSLLVSVWTDKQVQKQMEYAAKPQMIWESISRYMRKKGYDVTAKQCRSRMKQVLVCYKEAKKSGTHAGVERYYESIDRVIESKRAEKTKNIEHDIDTVDSIPVIMKSPPKDIKTNENLRKQHNKLEEVPISLNRHIEVYPGVWRSEREEYGDSSESNETVMVRPYRSLSPMRNIGTNTVPETMRLPMKSLRRSMPNDERFRYENGESNRFSEVPLKTGVQNVHNQIIQENMMLRNQLAHDNVDSHYQPTDYRIVNPGPRPTFHPENIVYHPNRVATNMLRMQSQLQQYSLERNMAMPQEPKKFFNMGNNAAINGNYKQYQRCFSEVHPPDIAPNLDDAFCQTTGNPKTHNLNETYDQPFPDNDIQCPIDATVITNNATFNDDALSIEFIGDSPSPTENGRIDTRTNSLDKRATTPNAPFRKKKAQKLEQMMLSAITSQTEVFNKILATQDVMVSRILDIDKDRHSRLENRLDQLMNVVQATVMNKSTESKECNTDVPVPPEPSQLNVPLCFSPPPKPGIIPPKLDLVPPKPCRVATTNPQTNIDLITQNQIQTRSDNIGQTKPGTIWSKLGPVSQSPFVKAQRQITAVTKAAEHWRTQSSAEHWRTRSSAERRIETAMDFITDPKMIIQETERFLQSEKLIEARIENARRLSYGKPEENENDRDSSVRRKLFDPLPLSQDEKSPSNKQPSASALLCAAFLDIERQNEEKSRYAAFQFETNRLNNGENLLTGQGESYERLRHLSFRVKPKNDMNKIAHDNMNTSTPAKVERENINDYDDVPRQTIQQLAELVMNSARWRNAASINNQLPHPTIHFPSGNKEDIVPSRPPREIEAQRLSRDKALDWLQDPYNYGSSKPQNDPNNHKNNNYPLGFTMDNINIPTDNTTKPVIKHTSGFPKDFIPQYGFQYPSTAGKPTTQQDLYNKPAGYRKNHQLDNKNEDDNDDDEFLDTTTTLHPPRKQSLTLVGVGSGSDLKSGTLACVIS